MEDAAAAAAAPSALELSTLPEECIAAVLLRLVAEPPVATRLSDWAEWGRAAVRALGRVSRCSKDLRRLAAADALWRAAYTFALWRTQRHSVGVYLGSPAAGGLRRGRLLAETATAWREKLRAAARDLDARRPARPADIRTLPGAGEGAQTVQWLMRFLPAAGGRDGDPPMEAIFGPERDEVLHTPETVPAAQPDDSSGSLVLVGGAYPPLPWSLLPGSPEEDGATLAIANFPPHAVRRSPIDGGWVSWNANVVLWTVDSTLEHTAAALKDLGNAQFRRGECLEALVTYGEAVSALLGGRQHESQMQSIGFVPPISWSTTEGNTWPEYVWLPDTAAQVWAKLTANIPAAVLRAIKVRFFD